MALERLEEEAAEVGSSGARPRVCRKGGDGGLEDARGSGERVGRKSAAGEALVIGAYEAVGLDVEVCGFAGEGSSAGGAVEDVGHPAHEARDPHAEVGDGQPDLSGVGVIEHGEGEAKDGVLRVVVREGLFEDLGKEGEGRGAGIIYGLGERRSEDFAGVEADQFLARLFDVAGQHVGHRLERSAEALTGFRRGLGDSFELALVAREERHDLIGLMNGPGAQDQGFSLVRDH